MAAALSPAALADLGNKLSERGESEAAVATFRHCLALAPPRPDILYNLGNALRHAGRPVDAVDAYVACLKLAPAFGSAYVNLADTLRVLTLLPQAQEMAQRGLHCMPDEPVAMICLANVLHDKADYSTAAELYRQVLRNVPGHAGVLTSLGNTLRAMGHSLDALAMHVRAVAIAPDNADFHCNRAVALLSAGDYATGWEEYEWRWRQWHVRHKNAGFRRFGKPWQGEDIAGRTILLHAEQGLGDTLQFVRYAPLVAARGARVVLEVQAALVRLSRQLPGIAQVVARGDDLPPFDTHCPLMSLPRAFTTRLDTIPNRVAYLHADPAAAAAWKVRLPAGDKPRIGLVWAGSPHTDNAASHLIDKRRSLNLQQLAPLADIKGVHWISLQKDQPDAPARAPPGLTLTDPMPEVTDFADTAALVANLDLVIAVDTSVAHLAGGLGRPVWLLSRYDGCWRWLHDRDDSPWYPSMRLYRQQRPLDWSAVITRIRSDLIKEWSAKA